MKKLLLSIPAFFFITSCYILDNHAVTQAAKCSEYILAVDEIIGPQKNINFRLLDIGKRDTVPFFSIYPFIGIDKEIWLQISYKIPKDSIIETQSHFQFIIEGDSALIYPIKAFEPDEDLRHRYGQIYIELEKNTPNFELLTKHPLKEIIFQPNQNRQYRVSINSDWQDYFISIIPCMTKNAVRNWYLHNKPYILYKE
ncbi:MAG: hypothetical protein R3B93_11240 [Bacteroidia bacterium]